MTVHQTLLRVPPKSVFQFLCEPSMLEEFSEWTVVDPEGPFGEGTTWTEKARLRKRTWTVTAYDRRGLTFTMEGQGVSVTLAAKKGGTGSCNVRMTVEGDDKAVARFEKTDGDRLERLKEWLEA